MARKLLNQCALIYEKASMFNDVSAHEEHMPQSSPHAREMQSQVEPRLLLMYSTSHSDDCSCLLVNASRASSFTAKNTSLTSDKACETLVAKICLA